MSDSHNFWIVFSTVAITLAGFALVAFSIFTTRTELAAADQVCRRHGLKEASSGDSWTFVFFAFFMFLIPIIVGLLILSPADGERVLSLNLIRYLIAGVTVLFIGFLIYALYKQCKYLWRVTSHNLAVESFTKREETQQNTIDGYPLEGEAKDSAGLVQHRYSQPRSDPDATRTIRADILRDIWTNKEEIILTITAFALVAWLIILIAAIANIPFTCLLILSVLYVAKRTVLIEFLSAEYITLASTMLLLAVSFLLLLVNLSYVFVQLGQRDLWYISLIPASVVSVPPQVIASITLLVGVVLIYFHFHLFQPTRLLLKVSDSTVRSLTLAIDDIETKCKLLSQLRTQLASKLEELQDVLISNLKARKNMDETEAKARIEDAKRSLEDRHWDPLKKEFISLLEKGDYHIRCLAFCLGKTNNEAKLRGFVTYQWIIQITNDGRLYMEGLNRFEVRIRALSKMVRDLLVDDQPARIGSAPHSHGS